MLRGGAGRIVFTPYFLCANILVILFLTVKYWSASNYEFELLNKVHLLEIELKSCKTTSINCGGEFKQKSKNLQTCQEDYQTLQNKYDQLSEDLKQKSIDFDKLGKKSEEGKSDMEEASQKCTESLEECRATGEKCAEKLKASEKSFLEVKSDLENCTSGLSIGGGDNDTLIESMKQTINELNSELLEFKSHVNEEPGVKDDGEGKALPNGELPDVNMDAVAVRSKPVNGMKFHTDDNGRPLPLLPRGDPLAPRPGPRFSVVDPPKLIDEATNSNKAFNASSMKPSVYLRLLKEPPKANLPQENLKNGRDSLKDIKLKPKNLDAREAENLDYDGEDQDPNGAIEDMDKEEGGNDDQIQSNVQKEVV